ncbi:MAG: hypothetical protein AAF242_20425, partial [Bacteroidota bacterium]
MKNLLLTFILLFLSLNLIGQSKESFTLKVNAPPGATMIAPVDQTTDEQGNIYVLTKKWPDVYGVQTAVIFKYHPHKGVIWTIEIGNQEKSISPQQLVWSKLGDLMMIGYYFGQAENNGIYFARVSSQGRVTTQKFIYLHESTDNLYPRKIKELAT